MRRRHKLVAALFGIGTFLSLLLIVAVIAVLFVRSGSQCGSNTTDDNGSAAAVGGGAQGAWTQKGTDAYKVAKEVFDRLHKDLGLSGAADAGVIGNIAHESHFQMSVNNSQGDGGHGLIQWTGNRRAELTAFAQSQGLDENSLELQIRMIEHDMKQPAKMISGKYGGQTLKSYGHLTDPSDAAWHFYLSGMEAGAGWSTDPDGSGPTRASSAVTAYQLFGGSNISADDSLLGGASDTAQVGASGEGATDDNKCSTSSGEEVSGKWGWPFKNIPKDGEPVADLPAQKFGHTGWFGRGGGDFHDGFDFGANRYNGDCLAVHDGKVHKIGNEIGWWYVWVKSDDGYSEVYQEGFTSRGDISVNEGDEVKVGDKIGHITGDHTHLGITKKPITMAYQSGYSDDGTWLDPIKVIKQGIND